MSETLPENIAAAYPDRTPGDEAHQHHHDLIHAAVNRLPADLQAVRDFAQGLVDALDASAVAADPAGTAQGLIDGLQPVLAAKADTADLPTTPEAVGALPADTALPDLPGTLAEEQVPERLTATALSTSYVGKGVPSYAGTRTKSFDPARSVYNATSANLRKARLKAGAAKQAGACRILCVGDSQTAGYGATAVTSWPMQMRDQLVRSGATVTATGMMYGYSGASDSRVTYTGTATNSGLFKILSSGATATFVTDVAAQNVDIHYFNNGGSFTYTIDGGAPTTVTTSGASALAIASTTGLANTTHTVVITATASNCYIVGVNAYSNSTGLVVNNAGMSGSKTSDWIGTAFGSYQAQSKVGLGGGGPDFTFISLGGNDADTGVSVATYKTNLTSIVQAYQSSVGPVILVAQPQFQTVTAATWETFLSAQYDVADALDVPLIDLYHRWGDYTAANGLGIMFDTKHPNAKGYADTARAAFNLLQG